MATHSYTLRQGSIADFDAVMALMDEAVAWLVGQDRTGQWGSEPMSGTQARRDRFTSEINENDLWLAELDGDAVGAMLLGEEPMPYVEAADEPEVYLHLLVTSARNRGTGIGQLLIDKARAIAAERGIDLIRVDCYAGDDQKLVAAYVKLGFTPVFEFKVGEWPGMVSEIRT